MRILLVNVTGHFGSTGKIVTDIHDYLVCHGHDVKIAYGHTERITEKDYFQYSKPIEARTASQLAKLGRSQYKGSPLGLFRIKRILREFNPNIVHIHCINGHGINVYRLFSFLAQEHIKTVITHHAEFYYTGACAYAGECKGFYQSECNYCEHKLAATFNRVLANPHKDWLLMKESINLFSREDVAFTAVSPWSRERSLLSPIVNQYDCEVVFNGLNTEIFQYHPDAANALNNQISRSIADCVLYVTHTFNPLNKTDIKGGYYVVELAKRLPNVTFVVVATDSGALGVLPGNVVVWGCSSSQNELACLYSLAKVTLLTSRNETFSMVTAESLCCGTPVVGFQAGGPESIAIKKYSCFVEYGDIDALHHELCSFLSFSLEKEQVSRESKIVYSREAMGANYLKVYQRLLTQ